MDDFIGEGVDTSLDVPPSGTLEEALALEGQSSHAGAGEYAGDASLLSHEWPVASSLPEVSAPTPSLPQPPPPQLRAPLPPAPSSLDVAALARALASTAAVSEGSRAHLVSLYALAVTTLARHGFSRAQLEAFLELFRSVVEADLLSWGRTAGVSFASLRARLLACSVARPPRSVGTFTPAQASAAVHFVLSTYYASFELYRTLRPPPRLELTQRAPSDVALPERAPPLARAVQIA